jgi:cyd operon protein YbgT
LAAIIIFALLLAVVAGDYGPWYFAWLVGTTMIILIAVAGAVMFETQNAVNADGGL